VSKKLILLSIILILLVGCNRGQKGNARSKSTILYSAAFDGLRTLKKIYGVQNDDNGRTNAEAVVWLGVDVPEPLSDYFHSTPKGRAWVIFDAPYSENGVEKHMLLTATAPADRDYECHACGLLVGGAIFRRSAEGWLMESQNKYISVEGKYGSVESETIRLIKVGPDRHGVLFSGADIHQGYISSYVSLLVPYEKSIVGALNFFVEGPGEGACADAVWEQGIELKPVKQQKNAEGFYDMEADARYNSGECGQVKPIRETVQFKFMNGKYNLEK
jgi:hypothetical protein